MQQNKIEAAITGIGAITPIGNDCESILASLRAGRDGITQATKIDASRFASQMCGETHFDYAAEMSAAELETFTDPFLRLAISAARRAAKNAGLPALPPRTAAVLATCNAGLNSGEAEYVAQYRDPSVKFGKAELDQYENCAIGKAVADALKIGGECIVINTACSGSTAALGIAQSLVESGRYDCVLAGGADAAALSNFAGFNAIKVMSPEKIAPFSTPVGMNIGEGAAFWIIENRGIAKARGAKIYGKIVGHATSGDAHHPTQPDPRGDGAFRTMRDAAADAGISPAEAGCINAHGSGTAANDRAESKGIAKFLGGANVPTTSTKSYTGHCMGATGIIEATCQLLAMNDNFIPPTLRNVGARAGCEIEAVGGAGIETEYDRFISANYAFAGNNAAVVVAKDSFVRREKPESEVKKNIDQMYAQADSALENGNPEVMNELKEQFGENPYELKNILKYWVRSDKEGLRVIPTDSIVMKIDKEAVRRSGMKIPEALGDSIPEYMTILLRDANGSPKRALYKSELMMLEMLANANWERPIYMAITVGSENHLGMDNHFMQEGLAYRFTPFDTDKLNSKINSEKMYDNLMNKFKFGGIEKPGIYIDENVMRMCYTHRRIFTQLVGQLIKEGKKDKALAALDYAEKMIPSYNVPYDWANGAFQMAEAYYQLGQNEKANKIIDELANKSLEYMVWYLSLTDYQLSIASENFMYNAGLLDAEVRLMEKYKSEDLAKHYSEQLDQLYSEYVARMKGK